VPRLWNDTIETHRREVIAAILDTTERLVEHHGLRGVTMSQIAERAGIGRATLYKYFKDVEAIFVAWHERQLDLHLESLEALGRLEAPPWERLRAVLERYAELRHEHHGAELPLLVHGSQQLARAHARLEHMVKDLLAQAVRSGDVREDVPVGELTRYCLHALAAAGTAPSKAAARRVAVLTSSSLRPPDDLG
jgi:AcrR family transcriptional regulator